MFVYSAFFRLHFNLTTLEVMMYVLGLTQVDLRRLEEMSDLDVVLKMMEGVDRAGFVARVHRVLMPHLERMEQQEPEARSSLLRHYLLHLSATSGLAMPLELIKHSQAASSPDQACAV